MECSECGCDCSSDFAFCPKCGTPPAARPKADGALERLKRLAPTGYADRVVVRKVRPRASGVLSPSFSAS
ncbi:MAG: hypothetical protein R6X31_08350 [Anaerolineae bacterium]